MPDHRVTIRLPADLYAQLEARGSHGQPLAAIVREALGHYLAWQPEQPPTADDTTTTLTAMAARIDDLQAQVQYLTAQLDALAAERQSTAATEQPRQPQPRKRQSQQSQQPEQPALDESPPFDPTRFVLGPLCPRRHVYRDTGLTLRRLPRHTCPACDREQTAERRKAKREGTK